MSPPGASAQWLDGVGVPMLASWRMVPRLNTRTLWSLLHTYSRSWSARARGAAGHKHPDRKLRRGALTGMKSSAAKACQAVCELLLRLRHVQNP